MVYIYGLTMLVKTPVLLFHDLDDSSQHIDHHFHAHISHRRPTAFELRCIFVDLVFPSRPSRTLPLPCCLSCFRHPPFINFQCFYCRRASLLLLFSACAQRSFLRRHRSLLLCLLACVPRSFISHRKSFLCLRQLDDMCVFVFRRSSL